MARTALRLIRRKTDRGCLHDARHAIFAFVVPRASAQSGASFTPRVVLRFAALLFGPSVYRAFGALIAAILRLRGASVGRGLWVEATPKLIIDGKASNIVFGDNVRITGPIFIKNRENGRLEIGSNVLIEEGTRLVAARDGILKVGDDTAITREANIVGGADIVIGRKCLLGPRVTINANDHAMDRASPIRDQGFVHAPVHIEDDCWTGANVVIVKGVTLGRGTVVGANAVVTKSTEPYSIVAGVPARKIGERP
jgi:acetyltransferase-like isoleucine patch superfamily enzyme